MNWSDVNFLFCFSAVSQTVCQSVIFSSRRRARAHNQMLRWKLRCTTMTIIVSVLRTHNALKSTFFVFFFFFSISFQTAAGSLQILRYFLRADPLLALRSSFVQILCIILIRSVCACLGFTHIRSLEKNGTKY